MTLHDNHSDEALIVEYVTLRERHREVSKPEKKAVLEDELERITSEWQQRGNDLSELLDRECHIERSEGKIRVELKDSEDDSEDARYRNPPKYHGVEGVPGMEESEELPESNEGEESD